VEESGGIKRRKEEEKNEGRKRSESDRVVWLFEVNFVADSSSYRYKRWESNFIYLLPLLNGYNVNVIKI
jgi:hypothetical protein